MAAQNVRVGPWGEGGSGVEWDDVLDDGVVYSSIHRIRVSYDRVGIRSIHIEYDNNGSTVWKKHGKSHSHQQQQQIQLDYPREILTSISGCYNIRGRCISSLTFERNWNSNNRETLGSGREGTTDFSSPNGDVKIVGFHGRSDEYLRSIGVYYLPNLHAVVPPQSLKTIVFGQLEGEAGYKWDDDRVYSGIRQIIVVYGDDAIDSINIEYDNNGSSFWLELGVSGGEHGVRARNKIGKIRLHYPHEILTSISGHYDTYLRSLTFESNLKEYGPYGSQRENNFESPNGRWKIVGFHGRSAPYLDFLGVSLSSFPKSVKPRKHGPYGGKGGDMWDDGVYSGIHQIIVVYDQEANAIASIDIQYDNNGSCFWSEHGGSTGNKIGKIQLDYPKEFLTSISGYYDTSGIRSLSIGSNVREYEPYGPYSDSPPGTRFFSSPKDAKIVGFCGRSDEYLRSIEVYYLHTGVPPRENPREGEEPSFNNRRLQLENPREGELGNLPEDATIKGGPFFESIEAREKERQGSAKKEKERQGSAKKGREARKKEGGSRAREEGGGGGSRAREEEEERKEEKEAEGVARDLSSLHI